MPGVDVETTQTVETVETTQTVETIQQSENIELSQKLTNPERRFERFERFVSDDSEKFSGRSRWRDFGEEGEDLAAGSVLKLSKLQAWA